MSFYMKQFLTAHDSENSFSFFSSQQYKATPKNADMECRKFSESYRSYSELTFSCFLKIYPRPFLIFSAVVRNYLLTPKNKIR